MDALVLKCRRCAERTSAIELGGAQGLCLVAPLTSCADSVGLSDRLRESSSPDGNGSSGSLPRSSAVVTASLGRDAFVGLLNGINGSDLNSCSEVRYCATGRASDGER